MAKEIEQRIGGPNSATALAERGMNASGDLSHIRLVGVRVQEGQNWQHKIINVKPRTVSKLEDGKAIETSTVFIPTNKELKGLKGKVWEISPVNERILDGEQPTTPIDSTIEETTSVMEDSSEPTGIPLPYAGEVNSFISSINDRLAWEADQPLRDFDKIVRPFAEAAYKNMSDQAAKEAQERRTIYEGVERKKQVVNPQIEAILAKKLTDEDDEWLEEEGRRKEALRKLHNDRRGI